MLTKAQMDTRQNQYVAESVDISGTDWRFLYAKGDVIVRRMKTKDFRDREIVGYLSSTHWTFPVVEVFATSKGLDVRYGSGGWADDTTPLEVAKVMSVIWDDVAKILENEKAE